MLKELQKIEREREMVKTPGPTGRGLRQKRPVAPYSPGSSDSEVSYYL